MDPAQLAARIDHTLLRPEARPARIHDLCAEAREWGFGAVCVPPSYVALAAKLLDGSPTAVATVVGFPLGNTLPAVKAFEARCALEAGATALDMVLHLGLLRGGEEAAVLEDLVGVVATAHEASAGVKVILETSFLTDEEKERGCRLAERAGAAFVKTSTGFGPAGASVEDVRLLRACVGERLGVKAAGGIRDWPTAKAMFAAGATRLGCSASVAILRECRAEES